MNYYWLKCETGEGLFGDESAIQAHTADGVQFTLYAEKRLLKSPNTYGPNHLRVLGADLGDGRYNILLPVDPFVTGRAVYVKPNQIGGMAA
ncbi:MAG: hypothetical protein ACE15F_08665 [bacterium]